MDFHRQEESYSKRRGTSRLQHAIDRNRLKHGDGGGNLGRNLPKGPDLFGPSEFKSSVGKMPRDTRDKGRDSKLTSTFQRRTDLPSEPPSTLFKPASSSSSGSSRTSVARPNDFKFEGGHDHVPKRSESKIKEKISPASENKIVHKIGKYFVIAGWCFSLFLLFRLVFAENGVMDYYTRKSALERKERYLSELVLRNQELTEEIKKMKESSVYQKKLVRDNLGFIAVDEFLVLFEKDS